MFVFVRSRKVGSAYIAASEITLIDPTTEEAVTRDGARYTLTGSDIERLIGDGMIRGVNLADDRIVAVPLAAIDHVVEDYVGEEWVTTVTTRAGIRFLADSPSRAAMNMDAEICDMAELRKHAARVRADDAAAEAAVEAAEALAGAAGVAVG